MSAEGVRVRNPHKNPRVVLRRIAPVPVGGGPSAAFFASAPSAAHAHGTPAPGGSSLQAGGDPNEWGCMMGRMRGWARAADVVPVATRS